MRWITKIIVGVWDFFFMFFGAPYEKQAERLDVDRMDMRGPENEESNHQYYRANKVSKEDET